MREDLITGCNRYVRARSLRRIRQQGRRQATISGNL